MAVLAIVSGPDMSTPAHLVGETIRMRAAGDGGMRMDGEGDEHQGEHGGADEEPSTRGRFGHSFPPFPPSPRRLAARTVTTVTRTNAPTPAPDASAITTSAQTGAPARP